MHPLSLVKSTNYVTVFHRIHSKNWFKNTLKTISKIYKFISIEEIESYYYENKRFNNCVHFCFDDGDKTVYDNAFPVLREMNIHASLFVSPKKIRNKENYWFQEVKDIDDILIKETVCELTNCNFEQINRYSKMSILKSLNIDIILKVIETLKEKHRMLSNENFNMTENQLIELHNSNLFRIGAHSVNHPILKNETDEDSEREISESIKILSQMLDSEIRYFAYPNGITGLDYGEREIRTLKENKIKIAFTSDNNFFSKENNPLAIPRGGLTRGRKTLVLSKLLLGSNWDILKNIIQRGISEEKQRKEIINLSMF